MHSPDSLANIKEKWIPEVKHFCPDVPIVLVGNKSDLRNDDKVISELARIGQHPVTAEEARAVANYISEFSFFFFKWTVYFFFTSFYPK
ncbi:unnamed protein product [Trichobilharzia regenti]|nr:unnamed protein product [Trichobilharzia regenti]